MGLRLGDAANVARYNYGDQGNFKWNRCCIKMTCFNVIW